MTPSPESQPESQFEFSAAADASGLSTAPVTASPNRAARRPWVDDFSLLVLLLVIATFVHYQHGPVRSVVYPSIMGVTSDPYLSDPPSMDEVWNLALSTGRGSPFDTYPRDGLVRQVPAWTSMEGALPWWKVWTSLSTVTHPPLYLVTLRLWRSIFGGSDTAAIALSCAWSCMTLSFVYLGARLALGRPAAFWSAAALAVSPVATYYAIEMRSYAMLTAESAIAIWLLIRLTLHGPRTRDVVGLCTVLLACMLTHYFSVAACVAAGAYALAVGWRRWRFVLICGGVTGIVYAIIWLPFMKQQFAVMFGAMEYLETDGAQVANKTALALCLPIRLLAELNAWPPQIICESVGALLIVCFIIAAIKRPLLRPFVVWFVAVVVSLWLADVLRHTQQLGIIRYCAAAQPPVAVLVPAIVLVLLRRTWVVHVAGVLVCGLAMYIQPTLIHCDAPTLTSAALNIATRMTQDDVLLVYTEVAPKQREYISDALVLEFAHVPGCFPRDAAILNHPMSAEMARQLQGRTAWVLNLTPQTDIAQIVPNATVLAQVKFWPLINLTDPMPAYRIKLPTSPESAAP